MVTTHCSSRKSGFSGSLQGQRAPQTRAKKVNIDPPCLTEVSQVPRFNLAQRSVTVSPITRILWPWGNVRYVSVQDANPPEPMNSRLHKTHFDLAEQR